MALDKQRILSELGNVVNQLQSADCGCMGRMFNSGCGNNNMNGGNMCGRGHAGGCMAGGGGCHMGGGGHMCGGGTQMGGGGRMGDGGHMGGGHMGGGHMGGGHMGGGHMAGGGHMGGGGQIPDGQMGTGGYLRAANQMGSGGPMVRGGNVGGGNGPYGGSHRNGLHTGQRNPCAGDFVGMNQSCMPMKCNPVQMYSDTYNYLNANLVKPTMQEVCNDLSSLTQTNTVCNNALASQMIKKQNPQGFEGQGQVTGNMPQNNQMQMNQNMSHMAGMGPQILNAMMGDKKQKGDSNMSSMNQQANQNMANMSNMGPEILKSLMGGKNPQVNSPREPMQPPNMNQHTNQLQPMIIDAPQSPHGKVGVTPLGAGGQPFTQNPNIQYMQQQAQPGNVASNLGNVNAGTPSAHPNIAHGNHHQQHSHGSHGMHSEGIKKFNEMFPGVTQEGNLGFDPMAIAIQMNPENATTAALNSMRNMMMGTGNNIQNTLSGQATGQSTVQQQQNPVIQDPSQQVYNAPPQQVYNAAVAPAIADPTQSQAHVAQNQDPTQQLANTGISTTEAQALQGHVLQQQLGNTPAPPQQVFAALTGNQAMNHQKYQQNVPVNQQIDQNNVQDIVDMNENPNNNQIDVEYNTFGLPVEMIPAEKYKMDFNEDSPRPLYPILQQRLTNPYSNVKFTMSKTSLQGNNLNRSASKTMLQRIYNQYKGSQSATQQNVGQPIQSGTMSQSQGKLHVANGKTNMHDNAPAPIERVGGDTLANNEVTKPVKMQGQIGDVPVAKPQVAEGVRVRNGLQDIKFTSAPISTAWSFHGVPR